MITQDLGIATAYGYAKSKGYTGTETEFAELMASYASTAQTAIEAADRAVEANTAAQSAKTDAQASKTAAQTAAQTAASKASEAVTAAGTATTKASEASQSASTASSAATSASTSAQTATTAAATATTKAGEASESATTATTAKTDAETARDAAAQSASQAAESARTLTIDDTLTQSGQAADAKATGGAITELKNDLDWLHDEIFPITGDYYLDPNDFVIGDMVITDSEWTYRSSSKRRVSTKEGVTYALKTGDKIGLLSYTNARFYLGWRRANGTYGLKGWNTSDVTLTEDGDYVILIGNVPDQTQPDKYALLNLLWIKSPEGLEPRVNQLEEDTDAIESNISYFNNRFVGLEDISFTDTSKIKIRKPYRGSLTSAWLNPSNTEGTTVEGYYRNGENHWQCPAVRDDKVHIVAKNIHGKRNPSFTSWNTIQIKEMDSGGNYPTSVNVQGDGNGNFDTIYTINNVNTVKFEIQFRGVCTSSYAVTTGYYEDIIADSFALYVGDLMITATNEEVYQARGGYESIGARMDFSDGIQDANVVNPYLHAPFHAHLGIREINSISSPAIIPSQSIWDIEMSARLGFKIIEGNVHATATSGKYVVMHGDKNDQIGNEIMDVNGNSPATTKFSEIAFNTLRNNYVYRSPFEKYRTPITSLEEFCLACRKYNIIPLLQYPNTNGDAMPNIVKSLLGNNWILYGGTREQYNGVMMSYVGNATTASTLETLCDSRKPPYIVCLGTPQGRYTDTQLLELISAVHNKDCLITFDKCYLSPAYGHHLLALGFDGAVSAWDVNEVNGNLVALDGDIDHSGFITTASVSGYNLNFGVGDTIEVDGSNIFLGKGILDVRFNGAFDVSMGRYATFNLESDGKSYERISTYFINEKPIFKLVATAQTTLYGIIYKADKC